MPPMLRHALRLPRRHVMFFATPMAAQSRHDTPLALRHCRHAIFALIMIAECYAALIMPLRHATPPSSISPSDAADAYAYKIA